MIIGLTGCVASTPTGDPRSSHSAAPSAAPTPTPSAPSFTPVDPAAYDLPWLGADDGVAFNSPDYNIACGIDKNAETGDSYGCAIAQHTFVEPPPLAGAVDPCGGGFWRFKNSPPSILCSGEPATFAGQPGGATGVKSLATGSSISFNGVTCSSAEDGITCLSADTHGFRISAASYNLY